MISYFEAPYSQRGHGFGGFFRGLAKFISPITNTVKKVVNNPTVRSLAKEAINTGVGLAADAVEGKNMKVQSKKALDHARKTVSGTLRSAVGNKRQYDEEEEDEDSSDPEEYQPKPRKRRIISSKFKKINKRRTIFD